MRRAASARRRGPASSLASSAEAGAPLARARWRPTRDAVLRGLWVGGVPVPVSYRAAATPPPRRGHPLALARLCLFGRAVEPSQLPAPCRHPDGAWRPAPVTPPPAPLGLAPLTALAASLWLPPLWPAVSESARADECAACDGALPPRPVHALPSPPAALLLLLLVLLLVAKPRVAARLLRRGSCGLARACCGRGKGAGRTRTAIGERER